MNFNKIRLILLLLPILAISGNINAQNKNNLFSVTDSQIKQYVEEVYQHEAEMVFNHRQRWIDIQDLLKNRIMIIKMEVADGKKVKSLKKLSSLSLLNFNNSTLKRDRIFDPKAFNPLKYDFDFFPKEKVTYFAENSYLIIISPQNTSKTR